ncbi:hypothetical protein EP7_000784 [Isosphaeraceae bacterium EP7]
MPPATRPTADDFLTIGPRIRVLPVIHGSGDFALRVREELLSRPYDCLAVPLPPSFQDEVEQAVERLPEIALVARKDAEEGDGESGFSYVPIDPCQPVIAGIRTAIGERIPREFIDLETTRFEAQAAAFPDPYALKKVSPGAFAASILPAIPRPKAGQHADRIAWMANRLRQLQRDHTLTLFVCSMLDWPWIRDAYQTGQEPPEPGGYDFTPTLSYGVTTRTLIFLLGEMPFITGLYERGRRELTPDDNLSVDGVKELVLSARDTMKSTHPRIAKRITPQLLSTYFRYVRNLSLIERRLTPDLHTLVVAAQQTAGDDFALAVADAARDYPYASEPDPDEPRARMGIDEADLPGWGPMPIVSRLPGQAMSWRSIELKPKAPEKTRQQWKQRWDPYGMCSWPPEDDRIESFNRHVRDRARAMIGADLARSEKFTSSVMDGLDVRETLRNWHTGDLFVKVMPPARGSVDAVVFLFDVPADPEHYPHRATWYAEHAEESTLAFFATDPMQDMVGPGIARGEYGGALFLFPPRPILDVWSDPRLDVAETPEERLLAAALLHGRERHVAVVSPKPPSASWRRLARRYNRKLIHLPLNRFGGQMIERLRQFHVLNGKHVRSYAADFISDG